MGDHRAQDEMDRDVLKLPAIALTALREHRVRQIEERLVAGPRWHKNELVFPTTIGTVTDAIIASSSSRAIFGARGFQPCPFTPLGTRQRRCSWCSAFQRRWSPRPSVTHASPRRWIRIPTFCRTFRRRQPRAEPCSLRNGYMNGYGELPHPKEKGPSWPFLNLISGGAGGIRTPYLLTASQTLSQLSYSPISAE